MMILSCPACGTETEYHGNENRPFCSERCRLLDFGAWVDEKYALPAEASELSVEDIEQLETAAQQDLSKQ